MAKLSEIGESNLIRLIDRRFRSLGPPPVAGIGEDAAIIRIPGSGRALALSTDLLLEGIHFRRSTMPPRFLGWKALAANLSDLAAVGARPDSYLLALGLPGDLSSAFLERFLDGIRELARRYRIRLLGGDICENSRVVIGITIIGSVKGNLYLPRTGARPGDQLYVTGTLGRSAWGLRLLDRGWRWQGGRAVPPPGKRLEISRSAATGALRAHLRPDPAVQAGLALARHRIPSAAIDISDGLSIDLARLCESSRTGALLEEQAIPVAAGSSGPGDQKSMTDLALHGGEDYELLISVPNRKVPRLESLQPGGRRYVRVGEIRPRRQGLRLRTRTGALTPLRRRGFRHFAT